MKISKTRGNLTVEWANVNWRKLEKRVLKLQKRIYQASNRGDVKAVRRLQKTLLKSWSAKMLAVRKVSQDNQGKNTAGIDGKLALTPVARFKLVNSLKLSGKSAATRRVMIPKPGKTEKRPLGIPTIHERAKQAWVKLAMEPEWEAKFEPNSYGFRPGRGAMDAIEAIRATIKQKSKYVLDADIAQCFDKIDHKALLEKISTFPTLQKQIKAWLKSGVMEGSQWSETEFGTPQFGVISPLLANIALHGLENAVKSLAERLPGRKQNNTDEMTLIRYADDFVLIHPDLEVVMKAKRVITEFLTSIGLELKTEKTHIWHTFEKLEGRDPGFDFLGFNVRQYTAGKYNTGKNTHGKPLGFRTLIKPSKKSVQTHYEKLCKIIDDMKSCTTQEQVIKELKPVITGWCIYFSRCNSAETFKYLKHLLVNKLLTWVSARHQNKSIKRWIKKYFGTYMGDNWRFMTEDSDGTLILPYHTDFRIERFAKVKGNTSPFDGNEVYWATRRGRSPELSVRVTKLLKSQKGRCMGCNLYLRDGDTMEIDHITPKRLGGKNTYSNYQLLHSHCHDIKTRKKDGTHDKSQIIEEPCEVKVSCTVLKSSHNSDVVA